MSSIGELTFFLGLQVKQKEDGIFISQDKYVTKILKKFGFSDVKTASTPMETHKPLLKDADGEDLDEHMYRSMIGSLMYLTSSRPDIIYLKGQPKLGLWYPKDSPFDLVAYTDSDYAGASLDRKSTTGGIRVNASDSKLMLLGINLLLLEKVNAARHNLLLLVATAKVKTVNGEVQLQALVDGKKVIITETSVRRYLQLEDAAGIECLPNADIFEQLALMGMVKNVDSSVKFLMYPRFVEVFLDKQVGDMSTHDEIFITPSHTKKVFGNMKRIGKGFSRAVTPLFLTMIVQAQEEIANEAANEENVPTQSNDPPLSRVNTHGSGEDRLKLKELIELCTKLFDRVLDLETTKIAQAKEIASLKKRVKKLERKRKSKSPGMKRLFKIGRSAQVVSFKDEGLGDQEDASKQGRKIDDIDKDAKQSEKVVEEVVSTAEVSATATITTEEITLAQAMAELRSTKPKIVVQEPV
ncbi:uncharacterized mitochondrial protein-like protein [Tanacetum coccineum]